MNSKTMIGFRFIIIIIIIAIELSSGGSGSSPHTSTHERNENKIYINETIQNTVNTSTHIVKTPTYYTHTHILVQDTHQLK